MRFSRSEGGGIGPSGSASLYCSSSDEDGNHDNIVQPTPTFYRNVIGNVNRLLDSDVANGNTAPQPHHYEDMRGYQDATDTTIYGMSSSNLSFATRQYLEKHGLVNSGGGAGNGGGGARTGGGGAKPGRQPQNKRFLPNPCNPCHPQFPSDRILDMNALKNQPKLT